MKFSQPSTPDATATTALAPVRAFAMLSHPGRVRRANEDTCAALPGLGAFVVCDGMGGAAAGEVASQLATEVFLHSLSQPHTSSPRARLEEAVGDANQTIFEQSQRSRSLRGMGTTLVAVLIEEAAAPVEQAAASPGQAVPTLWLAHVGDSRCYRLRSGALEQLTQDHSLVEEQIQAGILTRIQAGSSPIRNIITRAIGSQPTVEPEIAAHAIHPGDLYLLASDGLTRELTDAEIARILTRAAAPSLEAACHALIDAANHNGGGDNITVLLIQAAGIS